VKLNSVYQPLNGSVNLPNFVGGNTATSAPSGFSELVGANGPYTSFRVLGSTISVEFMIENAADALVFAVAPFGSTLLPTTLVGTATALGGVLRSAGVAQGGRSMIETSASTAVVGGGTDEEMLVSSTLLGNSGADPGALFVWVINYCLFVNQVTTAAIGISTAVSYDVLLEEPSWKALADGDVGDDDEKSSVLVTAKEASASSLLASTSKAKSGVAAKASK